MTLKFKSNGNFRIAQVTDVHLNHFPLDENDQEILHDLKAGLDQLKPDLIMITGDFMNSYKNAGELGMMTAFFEFLNLFDVPKAITYGNHDTENELTRHDAERLFEEIVTNRVTRMHEKLVGDLTQYVVEVYDANEDLARALYVLDTGHVPPGPGRTNDWILPEQVQWFREVSLDYGSLQNNLVFLHIPIQEYASAKGNIVSGELREPNQLISTSPINTGLFSELFFSKQIHGIFCGHNHLNNAEMVWEGIHLYYGMFCGKEEKAGDFRGIRYVDLSVDDAGVESKCLFYKDMD